MNSFLNDFEDIKTNNSYYLRQYNKSKKMYEKYDTCIRAYNNNSSNTKIAKYNTSSNKYASAKIKIEDPECSEIFDYSEIIEFTKYIENGEIKTVNEYYNATNDNVKCLIPNYTFHIGDKEIFKEHCRQFYKTGLYENYYLIDVEIPFDFLN